jgi:hypothetical protein
MNIIRRTLDIDTDARLREMADERGQPVGWVELFAKPIAIWVMSVAALHPSYMLQTSTGDTVIP